MNRRAFELALRAAAALNCEIAPFTKWDRKNYFYPDLPKSYQISQYDLPFSRNGHLEIHAESGTRRIGIERVHLEEDAGKMLHGDAPDNQSRIDLNRAGTPLVEIVSKPDLTTPEEARVFLEEIRLIMRDLEVSDCEMQEGSLRCDANINLHLPDEEDAVVATPIVEIKNLNSFRNVERALRYEAQRQFEEYRRTGVRLGEAPKATAGWDDARGVTVVQRRKEEAEDYRYFPEPDLVPVVVDAPWKDRVVSSLGELPAATRARFQDEYALSAYDSAVLVNQGRAFTRFFEQVASACADGKAASNWMTNQVLQTVNEGTLTIEQFPIGPEDLGDLIRATQKMQLNMQRAREAYQYMLARRVSANDALRQLGFQVIADEGALRELVQKAMAANAKAAADFRGGKAKAADAIKGAVMRETKGLANTEALQRILLEELARSSA
jgi:aspartyl-tRNA(Asn)/glutamyl-tRNA(Gln) amidotransferase subunit B